jgi:hypothetical protein
VAPSPCLGPMQERGGRDPDVPAAIAMATGCAEETNVPWELRILLRSPVRVLSCSPTNREIVGRRVTHQPSPALPSPPQRPAVGVGQTQQAPRHHLLPLVFGKGGSGWAATLGCEARFGLRTEAENRPLSTEMPISGDGLISQTESRLPGRSTPGPDPTETLLVTSD